MSSAVVGLVNCQPFCLQHVAWHNVASLHNKRKINKHPFDKGGWLYCTLFKVLLLEKREFYKKIIHFCHSNHITNCWVLPWQSYMSSKTFHLSVESILHNFKWDSQTYSLSIYSLLNTRRIYLQVLNDIECN